LVAKIGIDTAENDPKTFWRQFQLLVYLHEFNPIGTADLIAALDFEVIFLIVLLRKNYTVFY
jgi:hypothetical protein